MGEIAARYERLAQRIEQRAGKAEPKSRQQPGVCSGIQHASRNARGRQSGEVEAEQEARSIH
jgi:hypothetical protein